MIRYTTWIMVACIVCCLGVTNVARSEVIVADDFFYNQPTKPLGTLGGFSLQDYAGGQNGPAGQWTGAWVASGEAVITGDDIDEVENQFQGIVGDLGLPVNQNFLQRGYQTNGLAPDQTIFFSVQTRVDIDAVNLPRMWISDPLNEDSQISMGFLDGGFVAELGLDFVDGFDEPTNDGEVHTLVGKLEINAKGNDERLSVWLDPTGPEQGESAIIEGNVIDSINDLGGVLRLGRVDESCCGASGPLYWDDVALGTTWEDVSQISIPRLTLQVDPTNGSTALTNNSDEPFDLKFYEIQSPSGALRVSEWSSLDDQNTSNGEWSENNPNSNQLTESNFSGMTTLASGQTLRLGQPFDPAGEQDIVARFATDKGLLNVTSIEYGPISGLTGDFNMNGVLDTPDIDDLTRQSAGGANPLTYDLNADSLVNDDDIAVWIKDLFNSWVGDANLDGEFNTGDLVTVLASGTYEVDVDSAWSTGDFNGDGRSDSGDLVAALSDGGYEVGPRPAVAAVPEPSTFFAFALSGLLACGLFRNSDLSSRRGSRN